MTPTGTKRETRQRVLESLRAMSAATRDEKSSALRQLAASLLSNETALNIGIYIPMPHEVNLLPLLQEYPQHHYAAPRCLPGRQMSFHYIRRVAEDTAPDAHGIPAPHADLPVMQPEDIDILFVPGVAFTPEGDRLGYGGGYYDRFFGKFKPASIGVAYEEFILRSVPHGRFDISVDVIVSERGIYACK